MFDAKDESSYAIEIEVEQSEDDCTITFTPDVGWLRSEERVYPITIDPSVTTDQDGANYDDTYVHEGDSIGTNGKCTCGDTHNKNAKIYVGIKNNKVHWGYFKIKSLPSIPDYSSIYGVKITANCWAGTSTGRKFTLSHVMENWNHTTITWNTKPTSGAVVDNVARASNNSVVFSSAATNRMVQAWYTGNANYGCMIRYTDPSKTNPDFNSFYSSNCNAAYNIKRPLLNFTYTEPRNIANGLYGLRNLSSNKVLDASSFGGAGTQTVQWDLAGTSNQYWFFTKQSDGSYIISPAYNKNLALEVKDGGNTHKSPIQINSKTGSDKQRWYIYGAKTSDYYRIMSKCSWVRKGLMPLDKSTANGAKIIHYDDNGDDAVQWKFFEPEYGNGGAYRQVNTQKPNCFGYAMFSNVDVNLSIPIFNTSHKTENFVDSFIREVRKQGKTCRRIDSFVSNIEKNEYRVALRVPNKLDGVHIYHVIYQLSDGTWAGKDDTAPSKHFGYGNPDQSPEMWSNDAYSPSAGTIYFAVRRY